MFAFLVDQEIHDPDRGLEQHFLAAAPHAFFFQLAQDAEGHVVVGPEQAGAMAM